jgi:hypothetical protein
MNLQVALNLEVARKVQVMLQAEAEVEVDRQVQVQVRTARPASQMRSCRFASGPPDAK